MIMIKKWFQKEHILIIGSAFAVILPFLILSFFNHPQNDDYVAAASTKAMGCIQSSIRWYMTWSARYFSMLIMNGSLNPLILGSFFAYKLSAVVTILFLISAMYAFICEITSHRFGVVQTLSGALSITALYLFQVPGIAYSIYWMTGAVCYQYSIILFLITCTMLLIQERTGRELSSSSLFATIASFTVFFTAGANELYMILQIEVLAIVIILKLASRQKVSGILLLLLAIALVSFSIVVFAPGTRARDSYSQHNFWLAVQSAFIYGSEYIIHWITASPLVPATALFTLTAIRQTRPLLPFTINPILSSFLFIATYYGMFFPPFYNAGTLQPYTVSIIYFFFLIGIIIHIMLFVDRYAGQRRSSHLSYPVIKMTLWALLVIMVLAPDSNMKTAYADLFTGTAYRYNEELSERYAAIKACRSFTCDVAPLKDQPRTIFFFENAVDEKKDSPFFLQYKDNGYAYYFGKRRIRLTETPPNELPDTTRQ